MIIGMMVVLLFFSFHIHSNFIHTVAAILLDFVYLFHIFVLITIIFHQLFCHFIVFIKLTSVFFVFLNHSHHDH